MKKPDSNKIFLYLIFIALFLLSFFLDKKIKNFLGLARNPILDFAFGILTNFGIVVAIMLIIPLLMLKDNKKIYTLLLAFFLAVFISVVLKWMFVRQRPAEFIHPFIKILSYSFPSMHSVVVFSLLPVLASFLPKQKNFWALFAFIVPFTRLYFGLHYLSDVVFGAVLGYSVGYFLLDFHNKGRLWMPKKH
ncbi:phosphatase PAP2 family protein [Candidatus Woesearchaeota archaeon]|nr:phosphatase PAP2 family protein [Candidatus Woesearchaeota archaeon]